MNWWKPSLQSLEEIPSPDHLPTESSDSCSVPFLYLWLKLREASLFVGHEKIKYCIWDHKALINILIFLADEWGDREEESVSIISLMYVTTSIAPWWNVTYRHIKLYWKPWWLHIVSAALCRKTVWYNIRYITPRFCVVVLQKKYFPAPLWTDGFSFW